MKRCASVIGCCVLLVPAVLQAGSYDDGLRLKREQQLPQAEALFRQSLQENPHDVAALSELATVIGWQGRHAEAIAIWRHAVEIAPDAIEPRLGLARVLYWSGAGAEALTELARISDSYDAQLLRGDILLAQGDRLGTKAAYERARHLLSGSDDRDLGQLLARTEAPLKRRFDAGLSYEHYDQARGSESGSFAQLGGVLTETVSGYVRWDRLKQFDAIDHQFVGGAYWSPLRKWLLSLEAGGTPDPDFRPRVQAQTSVEWLSGAMLQPLFSYRYFGYAFGEVHTYTPGLRVVLPGAGELELRHARSRNTDESWTGVSSARYGWTRNRWNSYLAIYDGEEALPPQPKAQFRTLAAGGSYMVTRRWTLRLDYAHEDRKDFYIHQGAALALTYRF